MGVAANIERPLVQLPTSHIHFERAGPSFAVLCPAHLVMHLMMLLVMLLSASSPSTRGAIGGKPTKAEEVLSLT